MKGRARFLRYSLRTMLVVVLVLSVWLGWMANKAAKRRKAVEAIRATGGQVAYDHEYKENPFDVVLFAGMTVRVDWVLALSKDPSADPPWPDWLRKHLGIDWFANVVAVSLPESANDDILWELRKLPELRVVMVVSDRITDDGLRCLAELPQLERVGVGGRKISSAGMNHLRATVPRVDSLYSTLSAED